MDGPVGVVMITHNRRPRTLRSVGRPLALPERPRIVVVDDGSSDGTASAPRSRYPDLDVVASPVVDRQPVPPPIEDRLASLDRPQRGSTARRYVG